MTPCAVSAGEGNISHAAFQATKQTPASWGLPTRNTRVGWYLLSLEDPWLVLKVERSSTVTASRVAPGLQKRPGDTLLVASGPIRES